MNDKPLRPAHDDHHDYDTVTGRDIVEFLHHPAELRCAPDGPEPAQRAASLTRKADLFARIADKHARTDPA